MTAVAAGISCGGATHVRIPWTVGPDRLLVLQAALTSQTAWALKSCAIPGTSPVVACNAHQLTVLLANGEGWRLDDGRLGNKPQWRTVAPAMEANDMKDTKGAPALLAAGSACGVLWVATPDRRLWAWNAAGRAPLADAPVPGSARILAVDPATRTVLTDDSARLVWLGGRWCPMPGLLGSDGTVKVKAISSWCAGGERGDIYAGTELVLPEPEAMRLVGEGKVELVA